MYICNTADTATHLKDDISQHGAGLSKILLEKVVENVVQDDSNPEQGLLEYGNRNKT
jgi:hypothetical protein